MGPGKYAKRANQLDAWERRCRRKRAIRSLAYTIPFLPLIAWAIYVAFNRLN